MRLKNVPRAGETIKQCEYVIEQGENKKGKWNECVFNNNNPIHIEIGMGKGKFITTLANNNPKINYIGIEKYSSVLVRAVDKINEKKQNNEKPLENLRLLLMDATEIEKYFNENEVDKIYLNFSDPWPKDRHAKRRLTSTRFLERYNSILKAEGTLEFKTDNKELFDFSLDEIPRGNWKLLEVTRDLHNDDKMNKANVTTEYEEKFSSKGNPIYKLIAKQ